MHKFQNVVVNSINRRPFKIAERDSSGDVVWEDREAGLVKSKDGTVADVLKMLITMMPPEVTTRQDSIHGDRLWGQLTESERNRLDTDETSAILEIEDAEYDWIFKSLEDDNKGSKIFLMNSYRVERSIRNAEIKEGDDPPKPTKVNDKSSS